MQGRLQLAASLNCGFMQNYVFAADLPLVTCKLAATICVLKMIGQSYYRLIFICLCQSKRMPVLFIILIGGLNYLLLTLEQ
jgi:hypothetical protein